MNFVNLDLMDAQGGITVLSVQFSSELPWILRVSGRELQEEEFTGRDLFQAMIALRRELDASGKKLLCAGARRDVFPSGMARSMGSARKAYVMKLGEPATILVDIFEPAHADQIATVDEQQRFREQWIVSL
ncbi:MAG TPA: hypothetical protein VIT45_16680 [Allosphingosinicella sp.]